MWHLMKESKLGSQIVEHMIRKSPCLSTISEQSMYTIAHDIARFKEFNDGELIIRQDHSSIYDLQYKNEEAMCINQLKSRDPDFKRTQHQFMKSKYPKLSEQWKDHAIVDKHKDNMEGLKAIK